MAMGYNNHYNNRLWGKNCQGASSRVQVGEPVKVGVLLYKFDDTYISEVRKNLEEIQKENPGKVEFTFI